MKGAYRKRLLEAPAAERNKDAIRAVLERMLPASGLVLEVASGTGQHVVHFARAMPGLRWQPSDPDPAMRESVRAHVAAREPGNVAAPLDLDVHAEPWPIASAAAVLCINMIHIAPWSAAEALVAGAARVLGPGAPFVLYGPFMRDGRHTAPSNEEFDESLRLRNPAWGVRDLADVTALALAAGFAPGEVVEMPANNLVAGFVRE